MNTVTDTIKTGPVAMVNTVDAILNPKKKAAEQVKVRENRIKEIKNRLEDIKVEKIFLEACVKRYEETSGLDSVVAGVSNFFAGVFGMDTIEGYKNRIDNLNIEMEFLEDELKSIQELFDLA